MENVILSIDAGGTSTKYALYNKDGIVLKNYKSGPGSPAVNINAENDIFDFIVQIYDFIKIKYNLKAIIAGMSGYALVNIKEFTKKLKDNFHCEVFIESDAYMALFSILKNNHDSGVVVISGTGAIVLAVNKDKSFISNGWGNLLTERGSGYASIKDFICKEIIYREQTGNITPLCKKLMKHLNYEYLEDFKMLIYRHSKDEVAKLCKFFIDEANSGDKEAVCWLKENGKYLALDTLSAVQRVEINGKLAIGLKGGFFNGNPYMVEGYKETIKNSNYDILFIDDEEEPVSGGYYIAIKNKYF